MDSGSHLGTPNEFSYDFLTYILPWIYKCVIAFYCVLLYSGTWETIERNRIQCSTIEAQRLEGLLGFLPMISKDSHGFNGHPRDSKDRIQGTPWGFHGLPGASRGSQGFYRDSIRILHRGDSCGK